MDWPRRPNQSGAAATAGAMVNAGRRRGNERQWTQQNSQFISLAPAINLLKQNGKYRWVGDSDGLKPSMKTDSTM